MKKSLLITLGLLLSLSSFSYAAPQVIETYLQNDFLIKVDGEFKYHPEGLRPLVYENRTYLPAENVRVVELSRNGLYAKQACPWTNYRNGDGCCCAYGSLPDESDGA